MVDATVHFSDPSALEPVHDLSDGMATSYFTDIIQDNFKRLMQGPCELCNHLPSVWFVVFVLLGKNQYYKDIILIFTFTNLSLFSTSTHLEADVMVSPDTKRLFRAIDGDHVVEQLKTQDKNNNVSQIIPNNQNNVSSHTPAPRNQFNMNPTPNNLPTFKVDNLDRSIAEGIKQEIQQKQTLNPCAADFEFTQPPLPPNHDQSVMSDLTKFLLKKDLLLSRFQNSSESQS
ncbi:unnamed protein product [Mytilus coruscus]|uniref:Uncharacterized protein n=1 Tax=Mytilus coruscus TaxID=42192 RepID=A0A6J8CRI0_MYTCO|nr:unnamed protein product [Mytilus coruscus]